MIEPELNLRPYGEIPRGRQAGPIWLYDDPALSVARAQAKLGAWLEGARDDHPAGRAVWWPALVGVISGSLVAFGTILLLVTGNPCVAMLTWPAGFGLMAYALKVWANSAPNTPERCAREFAKAIERADYTRAHRLLAPVDKDAYLRPVATGKQRDPAQIQRLAFDSVTSFTKYWAATRALGASDRLTMSVNAPPRELSPGLVVVPFKVSVVRSLRLQNIAPQVIANKILLKYGNEWRVFDGELLSAAEQDNRWIRLPQE